MTSNLSLPMFPLIPNQVPLGPNNHGSNSTKRHGTALVNPSGQEIDVNELINLLSFSSHDDGFSNSSMTNRSPRAVNEHDAVPTFPRLPPLRTPAPASLRNNGSGRATCPPRVITLEPRVRFPSVESIKARYKPLRMPSSRQASSQPIPIKKCPSLSLQELEEEAMSEDSASHYDLATWCMYDRITAARRFRVVSRRDERTTYAQEQSMHDSSDPPISRIRHSRQQPLQLTAAEDTDDGIFAFGAM